MTRADQPGQEVPPEKAGRQQSSDAQGVVDDPSRIDVGGEVTNEEKKEDDEIAREENILKEDEEKDDKAERSHEGHDGETGEVVQPHVSSGDSLSSQLSKSSSSSGSPSSSFSSSSSLSPSSLLSSFSLKLLDPSHDNDKRELASAHETGRTSPPLSSSSSSSSSRKERFPVITYRGLNKETKKLLDEKAAQLLRASRSSSSSSSSKTFSDHSASSPSSRVTYRAKKGRNTSGGDQALLRHFLEQKGREEEEEHGTGSLHKESLLVSSSQSRSNSSLASRDNTRDKPSSRPGTVSRQEREQEEEEEDAQKEEEEDRRPPSGRASGHSSFAETRRRSSEKSQSSLSSSTGSSNHLSERGSSGGGAGFLTMKPFEDFASFLFGSVVHGHGALGSLQQAAKGTSSSSADERDDKKKKKKEEEDGERDTRRQQGSDGAKHRRSRESSDGKGEGQGEVEREETKKKKRSKRDGGGSHEAQGRTTGSTKDVRHSSSSSSDSEDNDKEEEEEESSTSSTSSSSSISESELEFLSSLPALTQSTNQSHFTSSLLKYHSAAPPSVVHTRGLDLEDRKRHFLQTVHRVLPPSSSSSGKPTGPALSSTTSSLSCLGKKASAKPLETISSPRRLRTSHSSTTKPHSPSLDSKANEKLSSSSSFLPGGHSHHGEKEEQDTSYASFGLSSLRPPSLTHVDEEKEEERHSSSSSLRRSPSSSRLLLIPKHFSTSPGDIVLSHEASKSLPSTPRPPRPPSSFISSSSSRPPLPSDTSQDRVDSQESGLPRRVVLLPQDQRKSNFLARLHPSPSPWLPHHHEKVTTSSVSSSSSSRTREEAARRRARIDSSVEEEEEEQERRVLSSSRGLKRTGTMALASKWRRRAQAAAVAAERAREAEALVELGISRTNDAGGGGDSKDARTRGAQAAATSREERRRRRGGSHTRQGAEDLDARGGEEETTKKQKKKKYLPHEDHSLKEKEGRQGVLLSPEQEALHSSILLSRAAVVAAQRAAEEATEKAIKAAIAKNDLKFRMLGITLENWMSIHSIQQMKIWNLVFPATHNSASWEIAKVKQKNGGRQQPVLLSLIKSWVACQHVNITEQLRRGVRWLDLRVCKFLEASPDDTPETAGKTARKDKTGEKRPVSSSSSSESRERSVKKTSSAHKGRSHEEKEEQEKGQVDEGAEEEEGGAAFLQEEAEREEKKKKKNDRKNTPDKSGSQEKEIKGEKERREGRDEDDEEEEEQEESLPIFDLGALRAVPYCAHGGVCTVPLISVLSQVRDFLFANPLEVVVLSLVADHGVCQGAFCETRSLNAGEVDFYLGRILGPFLGSSLTKDTTIQSLIQRRQRVIYFWNHEERCLRDAVDCPSCSRLYQRLSQHSRPSLPHPPPVSSSSSSSSSQASERDRASRLKTNTSMRRGEGREEKETKSDVIKSPSSSHCAGLPCTCEQNRLDVWIRKAYPFFSTQPPPRHLFEEYRFSQKQLGGLHSTQGRSLQLSPPSPLQLSPPSPLQLSPPSPLPAGGLLEGEEDKDSDARRHPGRAHQPSSRDRTSSCTSANPRHSPSPSSSSSSSSSASISLSMPSSMNNNNNSSSAAPHKRLSSCPPPTQSPSFLLSRLSSNLKERKNRNDSPETSLSRTAKESVKKAETGKQLLVARPQEEEEKDKEEDPQDKAASNPKKTSLKQTGFDSKASLFIDSPQPLLSSSSQLSTKKTTEGREDRGDGEGRRRKASSGVKTSQSPSVSSSSSSASSSTLAWDYPRSPFVTGRTKLVKSWRDTRAAKPEVLIRNLDDWLSKRKDEASLEKLQLEKEKEEETVTRSLEEDSSEKRRNSEGGDDALKDNKPFIFQMLCGEVTAPDSLGLNVLVYWSREAQSALRRLPHGIKRGAKITNKLLLRFLVEQELMTRQLMESRLKRLRKALRKIEKKREKRKMLMMKARKSQGEERQEEEEEEEGEEEKETKRSLAQQDSVSGSQANVSSETKKELEDDEKEENSGVIDEEEEQEEGEGEKKRETTGSSKKTKKKGKKKVKKNKKGDELLALSNEELREKFLHELESEDGIGEVLGLRVLNAISHDFVDRRLTQFIILLNAIARRGDRGGYGESAEVKKEKKIKPPSLSTQLPSSSSIQEKTDLPPPTRKKTTEEEEEGVIQTNEATPDSALQAERDRSPVKREELEKDEEERREESERDRKERLNAEREEEGEGAQKKKKSVEEREEGGDEEEERTTLFGLTNEVERVAQVAEHAAKRGDVDRAIEASAMAEALAVRAGMCADEFEAKYGGGIETGEEEESKRTEEEEGGGSQHHSSSSKDTEEEEEGSLGLFAREEEEDREEEQEPVEGDEEDHD